MTRRDRNEDAGLEKAWSKGRPARIKRRRSASSVLSIRIPSEVLGRLDKRAKAEGKPISLMAREMIEHGLAAEGPMTPADLARTFARWVDETGR